jgi:hypothetical protein
MVVAANLPLVLALAIIATGAWPSIVAFDLPSPTSRISNQRAPSLIMVGHALTSASGSRELDDDQLFRQSTACGQRYSDKGVVKERIRDSNSF